MSWHLGPLSTPTIPRTEVCHLDWGNELVFSSKGELAQRGLIIEAAVCLLFTPLPADCDNEWGTSPHLSPSPAEETIPVPCNKLTEHLCKAVCPVPRGTRHVVCDAAGSAVRRSWNSHTEGEADQGCGKYKTVGKGGWDEVQPSKHKCCWHWLTNVTLVHRHMDYVRADFSFYPRKF